MVEAVTLPPAMAQLRRFGRGLTGLVASRAAVRERSVAADGPPTARPPLFTQRHPLAMVYGGGGLFGIAYTAGIAAGLREAGVPVHTAPALGTSAGSWTASAVALGVSYDDLASHSLPRLPSRGAGVLADIAREIFGESRHPAVAASAVHVRSRRRHVLDGHRYPLADLVAASSAVPGLLPPHRVDGRLYVDGGLRSGTSLDVAAEADQVLLVAPLAAGALGAMGCAVGFMLERDVRRWQAKHPDSDVQVIRPSEAIARLLGLSPLALFDEARARDVYPLACEQGRAEGRRLLLMNPRVPASADGVLMERHARAA